jgi:hypothetical protein
MRTFAALVFLVSLLLGPAAAQTSAYSNYFSVVRMQMPEKYSLVAVQKKSTENICRNAMNEFLKEMSAKCPDCKVRSARCETRPAGPERALLTNDPLKNYSISAGDTRLLLDGKEDVTRPQCEQMARELSTKGVQAVCNPPGKPRS